MYCFDLDNTLITSPVIPGDYSTVLPIQKNIDFLKYLHRFGNTIIIYTARRMKTHNGNVGKVVADVGQQTMDTLTKFGIPYDEIYFGKPYADAYIDDLAVNHQSVDLEKYLGWYSSAATIAPRSFNKIVHSSIETITKTSRYTLSGEIYWYLNIHPQLKDIFPLLIDYSLEPDSMYYVIEKIEGVSVSSLYLSELLTPIMLNNILNTITRIQKIVPGIDFNLDFDSDFCLKHDLNIYANYTDKLCSRYTSNREFYALFPESQSCYDVITMRLEHYSANNLGRISCIHGDPVFTNIMINNYSKIKMFDMRGKLGDVETIYGDWLYDWAKIYQSLLGYDAILNNKPISLDYKTKMLAEFETYFLSRNTKADFEMLKTITCSLLFSLLPLHKENLDNCNKFYALINL
jgi:capsule biosynthesis phosphatase